MKNNNHNSTLIRFALVHFWPTGGGFRKRMEMLANILTKHATLDRIPTLRDFIAKLFNGYFQDDRTSILFYTSLMAPFILVLRLFSRKTRVFYMVRADEITSAKYDKRYFRALIAFCFQWLLNKLHCHFVFVSDDVRTLFQKRYGKIKKYSVLPNTLGRHIPPNRIFDGRVALVGDFKTVKNIEWALHHLSGGHHDVHLFGNRSLPSEWQKPWLHSHGIVDNLISELENHCTLVLFPDTSAGFPNVLVEALEAGCSVLVHRSFPFRCLPVNEHWRFNMTHLDGQLPKSSVTQNKSELEIILDHIFQNKRDFIKDNPELIQMIESDWEERTRKIFF